MANQPEDTPDTVEQNDAATPRRPYARPELVEYGTVAELTQTGGRTTVDFLFGLRRRRN